jgi:threonine synthase
MPTELPGISRTEISMLKGKPYHEVAYKILKKFLSYEINDRELKSVTKDAYDFELPQEKLSQYVYILRLDRGPTASFKDFAARLMAKLMQKMKPENKEIKILVATSGDTGSAIGEAYRGMDGIIVYILYPESEINRIQKRQMDSIGENVRTIAIDGKFDDCQKLVKRAFTDPDLEKLNLTSANSINIGRILPQIVYYFYSYINVADEWQSVIFSIPSGNFGNSLGCEIARRMGLPVKKIIIATNENDEFPKYLRCGLYRKIEPSRKCLSNAMNVGNPSNLARYFDLYGGIMDEEGFVRKKANLKEMNKHLYSTAISDQDTIQTIKSIYQKYGIVMEPHGAVGIAALCKYFQENEKVLSVCLETAHIGKFPEIIQKELNISPETPDSLRKIEKRVGITEYLPNDYGTLKKYLMEKG